MIAASELILNSDGSIYHLHLRPEHIANTIITVGDPDRVAQVSKYFDRLEFTFSKREFITHTGYIGVKRLSVISTGIGPDNIDIVFNEVDALFNVDWVTRAPKPSPVTLEFIRIGTSGALQPDLAVDSFLWSSHAISLDNLFSFYKIPSTEAAQQMEEQLALAIPTLPVKGQLFQAPGQLNQYLDDSFHQGITLTCPGFYAPQGRQIRLESSITAQHFTQLQNARLDGHRITNMEMETAAIYGMAQALGHQAISCNAILANRPKGEFSSNPQQTVERLIQKVLSNLVS